MSDTPTNHFSRKCEILGDLWSSYRQDEEFADFIEYNDLGLPLAYAFSNDLATPTGIAERYIEESYSLLLEALGLSDSQIFDSLEEMLAESDNR
jgi:hypothetical protein